jgi:hypothetical protein
MDESYNVKFLKTIASEIKDEHQIFFGVKSSDSLLFTS